MNTLMRSLGLVAVTIIGVATIIGSADNEKPDTEPNGEPSNGQVSNCEPINLQLSENNATPDANPCNWVGQTAAASDDQVDMCLVDPSVLTGTQDAPGVGDIEVRRAGTQVAFAQSASGSGPWTLTLGALDCNTPGTCGEIFDLAEYEVIINNPTGRICSDFGDLSITLELKE